MNDNTNTNITTTTGEAGIDTTPQPEGKTFSQDELNKIVSERLQRERQKSESALADRERELAQRELQLLAKERLHEKGLPPELIDVLNMNDEAALDRSIALLGRYAAGHTQTPPTPIAPMNPMPGGLAPTQDPVRAAMGLKT